MKNIVLLIALALSFALPRAQADDRILYEGIPFYRYQVPHYSFTQLTPQLVLEMDYAQFDIQQEQIDRWSDIAQTHRAYEIDLVFTLYPKDIKRWRTNYDELLRNRIYTLLAADSTLRDEGIRWNMILQTKCETEEEAKDYFHGFVIKYRPKRVRIIERVTSPKDLKALITGQARTRDSTVLKVMDRNPHWRNMLIVADWTGSMYKYGAQLLLWHKHILSKSSDSHVRHFVFFNDGNKRSTAHKVVGRTGGVFHAKSTELPEIVKTMLYVMRKGNGGDTPENDIEALLTGIQYLEQYEDVILIADNKSDIRDFELLDKLDRPIRIILCGVKGAIHPHYLELAFRTGGSIHTLEHDLLYRSQALNRYNTTLNKD